MIGKLEISRYKSIDSLQLDCRRVNVFIGAPDTGKTNILDALTFLTCLGWGIGTRETLRLSDAGRFDTLFFRQFFDQPFRIAVDVRSVTARVEGAERLLRLTLHGVPGPQELSLNYSSVSTQPGLRDLRSYAYPGSEAWTYEMRDPEGGSLVVPPYGTNLMYLARHHGGVNEFLREVVSGLGWRLRFDPAYRQFFLSDVEVDPILDYSLNVVSDSLKRYFFYGAILLTSRDAVVVLDEPDVFAFPPYPKLLGEMIAKDTSGNQFFVTTHNPYFLAGIVEKTPTEELAIFVCYRDEQGTSKVTLLGQRAVTQVIEQGASVFFNLDALRAP